MRDPERRRIAHRKYDTSTHGKAKIAVYRKSVMGQMVIAKSRAKGQMATAKTEQGRLRAALTYATATAEIERLRNEQREG